MLKQPKSQDKPHIWLILCLVFTSIILVGSLESIKTRECSPAFYELK